MQRYNAAIAVHEFFSKKFIFFLLEVKVLRLLCLPQRHYALQRCSVAVLQLKIRLLKCKK